MGLPFSQYTEASFQWLAENGVGYMMSLVNTHRIEGLRWRCSALHGLRKDLISECVKSFPHVSNLLEENFDGCVCGQRN